MPKRLLAYASRIVAGLLFALAVFVIVEAAQQSPSFQQCKAERKAHAGNPDQNKLSARASVVFRCAGVFLDNNSALVSAIATAVIAWFTISLARATRTQAILTRESIQLSRHQILAIHRPKVRIRNVVVHPAQAFFQARFARFAANELVHGQLYMANVGGTPAHIKETLCEVFWINAPLPMERPYEGRDGITFNDVTIVAGSSYPLPFASDKLLSPDAFQGITTDGSWRIYVMGWVEYEDDRKIRRRTAFCREYDRSRHRFFPVQDADYEHEE
jgi:hypothetical protein